MAASSNFAVVDGTCNHIPIFQFHNLLLHWWMKFGDVSALHWKIPIWVSDYFLIIFGKAKCSERRWKETNSTHTTNSVKDSDRSLSWQILSLKHYIQLTSSTLKRSDSNPTIPKPNSAIIPHIATTNANLKFRILNPTPTPIPNHTLVNTNYEYTNNICAVRFLLNTKLTNFTTRIYIRNVKVKKIVMNSDILSCFALFETNPMLKILKICLKNYWQCVSNY